MSTRVKRKKAAKAPVKASLISFGKLFKNASVRVTPELDGAKYMCKSDLIMAVCKCTKAKASKIWKKLAFADKERLAPLSRAHVFAGATAEYVIDLKGAVLLIFLLTGETAECLQLKGAEILVKSLGGDPSLISECMPSANASEVIAQSAVVKRLGDEAAVCSGLLGGLATVARELTPLIERRAVAEGLLVDSFLQMTAAQQQRKQNEEADADGKLQRAREYIAEYKALTHEDKMLYKHVFSHQMRDTIPDDKKRERFVCALGCAKAAPPISGAGVYALKRADGRVYVGSSKVCYCLGCWLCSWLCI